ncbi:TolC family protein [Pacificimonas flava]|uniref:Heavy metal RND efflux outer membrane protein, CzcC family n=1 Tax=Pacificimonas flava TaxID=1234595 RepID=M2U5T0_9SPHN|nr:TolC family protein [Pacificimonas flava]EMD83343.1 Heavy metal RND efflux outer membrane protein, CzcC family [Pacificimonas flava]MBB5279098.1 cobalt-zinc-cadmium efflux system outer membrane protein [Pacificimonas flava]
MQISAMGLRAACGVLLAAACVPAAAQESAPLGLAGALSRAGALAPALEEAQANVDAAAGAAVQAGLAPNPELSAELENVAGSGAFSGLRSVEATLAVSQRLELGGKRGARRRAAREQLGAVRLEALMTRADLALAVRSRFIEAAAATARAALAESVVERAQELARIAGALVDAGREPPLRSLRAEAALGEAEAALAEARAVAISARYALASLWGETTAPPMLSAEIPELRAPSNIDSSSALAIQTAAAQRGAAEAAVSRERAYAVPDMTVSAGVRRLEGANAEAAVVSASIGLPFRNRNQGNILTAQARVRGAAAQEQLVRAEFYRDTARARAELRAAEARSETLAERSVPQAEDALRLARIGYRNGRFTLIDVLDAAATRDAVRRSLIAARAEREQAAARLIRLAATEETY